MKRWFSLDEKHYAGKKYSASWISMYSLILIIKPHVPSHINGSTLAVCRGLLYPTRPNNGPTRLFALPVWRPSISEDCL
jgi:hypothetical protein